MIRLQRVALGATAAIALATGSCAPGKATTAVTAAPGQVGRFVWHDLVTRDAAAARKFYGTLLGWEFQETHREGRPYLIARYGDDVVGGIIELKGGEDRPATWLSYLAVPDLDGAIAQVTSGGGKVLLAPRWAGDYGVISIVTDPQGAPLGLAVVTDKVAAEAPKPRRHQFFWMEYLAKDGPAALEFYQQLAGYATAEPKTYRGIVYHVLSNQRPRAGLFQIPARANIQPNWLPYVLVNNPTDLAARVEGLGGKVLIAPHMDVRSGSLTVVADPTGAAIALQKWPM